jgi:hypothetical protein
MRLVQQLLSRSTEADSSRFQQMGAIAHFQRCERVLLDK